MNTYLTLDYDKNPRELLLTPHNHDPITLDTFIQGITAYLERENKKHDRSVKQLSASLLEHFLRGEDLGPEGMMAMLKLMNRSEKNEEDLLPSMPRTRNKPPAAPVSMAGSEKK